MTYITGGKDILTLEFIIMAHGLRHGLLVNISVIGATNNLSLYD